MNDAYEDAVLFDAVPVKDRAEFVSYVLAKRLDSEVLLRDWHRLGVACEAEIAGCDDQDIVDGWSPEALARLALLAEEALLARLPTW